MGTFEFFRWRESERLSGTGQAVVRPIVDVTLTRGDLDIRTPALIDTGAPKTLFPRGAADVLDIEFPLKSAPNVRQHDILGRRWPAVTELVSMSLDSVPGLVWEAEVDFLFDEGIPFGLLGLDGFLNKWAVTFVASNNYFVVETVDSFEERIPIEPFVEFQHKWPDTL